VKWTPNLGPWVKVATCPALSERRSEIDDEVPAEV
jgi:hypothetical protein